MNDFLTSLAARTLGRVPVVTPPQPARFETTSADRGAAFDEIARETDSPEPGPVAVLSPASLRPRAHPTHPQSASDPAAASQPPPVALAAVTPPLPAACDPSARTATAAGAPPPPERPAAESPDPASPKLAGFRPREQPRPAEPIHHEEHRASPRREHADTPPAIHVSIGRVEVRAIHRAQPNPPAPTPLQPPRRSLEEYLRPRRS